MKHIAILLSLWLAIVPALADGIVVPGVPRIGNGAAFSYPPSSGGGGSPTWINTASSVNSSCGFITTCKAASAVTIASGMIVVVAGINNQGGISGTITGISVCGTNLTVDSSNTIPSSGSGAAIGHGSVSGGSCDINVTFSVAGAVQSAGVGWGNLTNLSSGTPGAACGSQFSASASSPYPCSGGITVSAGGFGISGYFNGANSTVPSSGDAALTVDSTATGTNVAVGIGHTTTTITTNTIWAGQSFGNLGIIGAPWR